MTRISGATVFLPFLFGLLVILSFRILRGHGWRSSLVHGAVVWGLYATALAELLSLAQALTRSALAAGWAVGCALAAAYLGGGLRRTPSWRKSLSLGRGGAIAAPLLAPAGLLVLAVAVAALFSPPNTEDVQLYHMPRVLFWLQNRSLAHYATANYQQLFMPPGAEIALLHLYALAGGDRFVNLVAFFAYLGSAFAASLVAQSLGAGRWGQVVSAIFTLTIPQGVLAASGAKNDWILAFWLLSATALALRYLGRPNVARGFHLGAAVALALLTKATAYVFAPFLLAGCAMTRGRAGFRSLFKAAPLVAALVLIWNGSHWLRNVRMFGSPMGCDGAECGSVFKFANSDLGPRAVASNLARNLLLHATTPVTPASQAFYSLAVLFLHVIGADPNDPKTTWPFVRLEPPYFSTHENLAGNPVHLLLAVLCLAWLALGRKSAARPALCLGLGAAAAFVAFCWAFRWQPWHTRLHLPLFVAFGPPVGVATALAWNRWKSWALATFLLVYAAPFALFNEIRPLAGPTKALPAGLFSLPRDSMFRAPQKLPWLIGAIRSQRCRQVGLDARGYFYVYPLLHWLGVGLGDVRVISLSTDARFVEYYRRHPVRPCAVIFTNCSESPARGAECEMLGPTAAYDDLRLVTSLDADWIPGHGWKNRARMPRVISVTPDRGSGGHQVFRLELSDPDGGDTITSVSFVVHTFIGAGGCFLSYNAQQRAFRILSLDGSRWLGPAFLGGAAAVGNERCSLAVPRSRVVAAGTRLVLELDFTFHPPWRGEQTIYAEAEDNSGLHSSWREVGKWLPQGP